MIDVRNLLWSFHNLYVNQTILLYILNMRTNVCQLLPNKTGKKKKQIQNKKPGGENEQLQDSFYMCLQNEEWQLKDIKRDTATKLWNLVFWFWRYSK